MKKIVYFILLPLILGLVLLVLKQIQNTTELQKVLKNAEQSREIAKQQTLKAQNAEKMALIKAEEALRSKLESEKALEKVRKELQLLK